MKTRHERESAQRRNGCEHTLKGMADMPRTMQARFNKKSKEQAAAVKALRARTVCTTAYQYVLVCAQRFSISVHSTSTNLPVSGSGTLADGIGVGGAFVGHAR